MTPGLRWEDANRRDAARSDTASGGDRIGHGKAATAKQQQYLDSLAQRAGEVPIRALTRAHASREIERLRKKLA